MLGQVNAAILTRASKVANSSTPNDLRPVACCYIVYKCTIKIIFLRMKTVLPYLMDDSQGTFVELRSIKYNIMICDVLVKLYKGKVSSLIV